VYSTTKLAILEAEETGRSPRSPSHTFHAHFADFRDSALSSLSAKTQVRRANSGRRRRRQRRRRQRRRWQRRGQPGHFVERKNASLPTDKSAFNVAARRTRRVLAGSAKGTIALCVSMPPTAPPAPLRLLRSVPRCPPGADGRRRRAPSPPSGAAGGATERYRRRRPRPIDSHDRRRRRWRWGRRTTPDECTFSCVSRPAGQVLVFRQLARRGKAIGKIDRGIFSGLVGIGKSASSRGSREKFDSGVFSNDFFLQSHSRLCV